MKAALLLALVVVALAKTSFSSGKKYSAVYDSNTGDWSVAEGTHGVAWAVFDKDSDKTGWDVLEVVASSKNEDALLAFGAGFIEGALTHDQIWNGFRNFANGTSFSCSADMENFILEQDKWVRSMAENTTGDRAYWNQVALSLNQVDGIFAAYTQYAPASHQITYFDFLAYQLQWEIGDIAIAVGLDKATAKPFMMDSHCSSLVKLTEDGHLYTSHVTWTGFNNMLRVFKHYRLDFADSSNQANVVSFSSFPGVPVSGDDWYITSTDLVVMETTNEVMNSSLYAATTTATVPYWIRVQVANRVATSGDEWVQAFGYLNSGTYNNQWMIIDYKLFTVGQALQPNTLWIAEQIPGYYESADVTMVLESASYWSSYNIPYFTFIYNISGYPGYYQQYGDDWSYSQCARAQIFRRDQGNVKDLSGMRKIMRYNQYQIDPLSKQDACKGISARCDLNAPWTPNTMNPWSAFGAIDAKITDSSLSKKMETKAISGPTWDAQPPFAWTEEWNGTPHYGHPKVFAFDWQSMSPKNK